MNHLIKVSIFLLLTNQIQLQAINWQQWARVFGISIEPKFSDFYKEAQKERFEDYCKQIKEGSLPGSDISIQAIANIFKKNIKVTKYNSQQAKTYYPEKTFLKSNEYPFIQPIEITKHFNSAYRYDIYGKNIDDIYSTLRSSEALKDSQFVTIIKALRERNYPIPTTIKKPTGIYAFDVMFYRPRQAYYKFIPQNPTDLISKQHVRPLRDLVAKHIKENPQLKAKSMKDMREAKFSKN